MCMDVNVCRPLISSTVGGNNSIKLEHRGVLYSSYDDNGYHQEKNRRIRCGDLNGVL